LSLSWYGEPSALSNAIGYAKHRNRSENAVIRVYDDAGNAIETHKHAGGVQRVVKYLLASHFSLFFDASGKLTVCY
jgi:hypothetical protein